MSSTIPTCPTGCDSVLPPVEFDYCTPNTVFGEIKRLYVASNDAAAFTDVESAVEWAARLSEDGVGTDDIRELHISADMPAPTQDAVEIDQYREIYPPASFTINLDIYDLTDDNYEFMRTTFCNNAVRAWFATEDHMYGGVDGIVEANLKLTPVIERGSKTPEKFMGTLTWDAKYPPERSDNPL